MSAILWAFGWILPEKVMCTHVTFNKVGYFHLLKDICDFPLGYQSLNFPWSVVFIGGFHLLKDMLDFPLLVSKIIYHWTYFHFSRGLNQMEGYQSLNFPWSVVLIGGLVVKGWFPIYYKSQVLGWIPQFPFVGPPRVAIISSETTSIS